MLLNVLCVSNACMHFYMFQLLRFSSNLLLQLLFMYIASMLNVKPYLLFVLCISATVLCCFGNHFQILILMLNLEKTITLSFLIFTNMSQ